MKHRSFLFVLAVTACGGPPVAMVVGGEDTDGRGEESSTSSSGGGEGSTTTGDESSSTGETTVGDGSSTGDDGSGSLSTGEATDTTDGTTTDGTTTDGTTTDGTTTDGTTTDGETTGTTDTGETEGGMIDVPPDLPEEDQICDNGGQGTAYVFQEQWEIDVFLADCDVLAVSLRLTHFQQEQDPIVDLTPLLGLTRIEGDLFIETSQLASLDGLDDLRLITGDLRIDHAFGLADVVALHGTALDGDYYVKDNDDLCQDDAAALFQAIQANGFGGNVTGYIPNNGPC